MVSLYIGDLTWVVISYEICGTSFFASFINAIWNDYKFTIFFIIWLFKMDFFRLKNKHYFNKMTHCWHRHCQWCHMYAQKCYFTCVIIQFLWQNVTHWVQLQDTKRVWKMCESTFYHQKSSESSLIANDLQQWCQQLDLQAETSDLFPKKF